MADLLLMDNNGRRLHTASDPTGYKNFMFTWTTDKTFVTGSLAGQGEEALRLWDVRSLQEPIFSQMTESSLGFELMDDQKNDRKWLIGVHTEKVFGVATNGPFCEWSTININQANVRGFSHGNLDIHNQEFPVFGVPHSMAKALHQYGLPYVDGGLVKYGPDSLVIVVESFNQTLHNSAQVNGTTWPRFAAARTGVQNESLPFTTPPTQIELTDREPGLFWMEGLHPNPTGNGFIIASKHLTKPNLTLKRNIRSKVTDFTSYYVIEEGVENSLCLRKTATMLESERSIEPHPEWKKPNHFKFSANGKFVGRIVEDKLRIVTNGAHVKPFCGSGEEISNLQVVNEVGFGDKNLRNFAISPLDCISCAVSCSDGKICIVQPVW